MKNIYTKLEVSANIAILLVAIIFAGVLISRYFGSEAARPKQTESPVKAGMKLPLSDVDWSKSQWNVVLALSTSCHFCTESMPFYRRLAEERAERDDVRLIVVMPQSVVESKRYIDDKNMVADDVRQIKLSDINVAGTPTLIVVDQTGAVVDSWVGRLPPEKESDVLTRVFGERAKL